MDMGRRRAWQKGLDLGRGFGNELREEVIILFTF
jgi:hypothetical protein